jgi:hypothetical protein
MHIKSDGQTDRRTDRRTDRLKNYIYRLKEKKRKMQEMQQTDEATRAKLEMDTKKEH